MAVSTNDVQRPFAGDDSKPNLWLIALVWIAAGLIWLGILGSAAAAGSDELGAVWSIAAVGLVVPAVRRIRRDRRRAWGS